MLFLDLRWTFLSSVKLCSCITLIFALFSLLCFCSFFIRKQNLFSFLLLLNSKQFNYSANYFHPNFLQRFCANRRNYRSPTRASAKIAYGTAAVARLLIGTRILARKGLRMDMRDKRVTMSLFRRSLFMLPDVIAPDQIELMNPLSN